MRPARFLPYLRDTESLLDKLGKTLFLYWSSHSAGRLVPKGPKFRTLAKEADCLSIMSMEKEGVFNDESTFLLIAEHGALYIDLLQIDQSKNHYWCRGSIDLVAAENRFQEICLIFDEIDPLEVAKAKDTLNLMKFSFPSVSLFTNVQQAWNSHPDSYNGEDPYAYSRVPRKPLPNLGEGSIHLPLPEPDEDALD